MRTITVIALSASLLAGSLAIGSPATAQQPTLLGQAFGLLLGGKKAADPPAAAAQGAGTRPTTGRPSPVSTFDVAGVRLGDSAAQVRAAIAKAGYVVRSTTTQEGFEDRVVAAVAQRKGLGAPARGHAVPQGIDADGPSGAFLGITFMATPAGTAVFEITWRLAQEAMTPEAFLAQATSRYGKPGSRINDLQYLWCEAADVQCFEFDGAFQHAAHMRLDMAYGMNTLRLTQGWDIDKANAAAIAAEVDRRAPRLGKAAF